MMVIKRSWSWRGMGDVGGVGGGVRSGNEVNVVVMYIFIIEIR